MNVVVDTQSQLPNIDNLETCQGDFAYLNDVQELWIAGEMQWGKVTRVPGQGLETYTISFSNKNDLMVYHNLNRYPEVIFRDSAGTYYEVSFDYVDLNTVHVYWNGNASGTITCT